MFYLFGLCVGYGKGVLNFNWMSIGYGEGMFLIGLDVVIIRKDCLICIMG